MVAGDASKLAYDAGLRDGQLAAIESTVSQHADRLDHHSRRLRLLERSIWAMFGMVALMEFLPNIKTVLGVE